MLDTHRQSILRFYSIPGCPVPVLLKLAEDNLASDSSLGLGYLLALSQVKNKKCNYLNCD